MIEPDARHRCLHNNGRRLWKDAAAGGVAFAYAKATEETGFTDPKFAANWAGMKEAASRGGPITSFHPAKPVEAQTARFIAAVGGSRPATCRPLLDIEETTPTRDEWIACPRPSASAGRRVAANRGAGAGAQAGRLSAAQALSSRSSANPVRSPVTRCGSSTTAGR